MLVINDLIGHYLKHIRNKQNLDIYDKSVLAYYENKNKRFRKTLKKINNYEN